MTVETVLSVIASGGALFNAWQISRLSGRVELLTGTTSPSAASPRRRPPAAVISSPAPSRVDSMESTLQAVVTVLASGGVNPRVAAVASWLSETPDHQEWYGPDAGISGARLSLVHGIAGVQL